METRTKQVIATIAVVGILFTGGLFYNQTTNEVIAPEDLPEITLVAEDYCQKLEVTRIHVSERLSFWGEEWFTANDIISEIASEYKAFGESDRYNQLLTLQEVVTNWLNSADFQAHCAERISEVISKEEVINDIKIVNKEIKNLISNINE